MAGRPAGRRPPKPGRRGQRARGRQRTEVRQGGAGFSGDPVAAMLSRAEPSAPRILGELISRLDAGGQLRGVSLAVPTGTAAGTVEVEPAPGALAVSGVAFDSREVIPGCVFVAIAGDHADGHDFVEAAAGLGAVAAIVEREAPGLPLPQIVVGDTRLALATAAAWWYGDPSLSLGVVGITGTDGKTTTAFLAAAVLERAGISTGLLTTAEVKIGEVRGANPGARDDASGAPTPACPAGNGGSRQRGGDRRDDLARTGPASRGRDRLRHRDLHEPDATSTWSCTVRSRRTATPSWACSAALAAKPAKIAARGHGPERQS